MANMVTITALGSGSDGNSFAISYGDEIILVDAGFSCRELCRRLDGVGLAPENIRAILVTHEHGDHVRGCRVLCNKYNIPLFATALVARYMQKKKNLPDLVRLFEVGSCFSIGSFEVSPFSVPHDAESPVGFIIRCQEYKIGLATDLGQLTPQISSYLNNCHALVFESNYDQDMLFNSPRDLSLKRRIHGPFGHMNNMDTMNALPNLIGEMTKLLMLVHISSDCNTRELVNDLAHISLRELEREDVEVIVVEQHTSTQKVKL